MIRIIGGVHRSRQLEMPQTDAIRPTSDKLRQAVFNILMHRVNLTQLSVLDACCGTGAMGLEAISRGAAQAIFMDNDKAAMALARRNAEALKEDSKCRFVTGDITRPPAGQPVNLIFLDPPYGKNLAMTGLAALTMAGWTDATTLAIIEVGHTEEFVLADGWRLDNERIHGAARLLILENIIASNDRFGGSINV